MAIAAAGSLGAVPVASMGVREHGRCISGEANPYVATISADRCRIEAVWTTRHSGQQGDLILGIKRK